MTSRERLRTVFAGETPDRVPVSLFVQEEFLGYYFPNRAETRRLEEAVDCARELDFDIMVRGRDFEFPHFMKKSFPNWELNSCEKVEGGNLYYIFEIQTPERTLRQVEVGPNLKRGMSGIHRSICEYLIKDEADFEAFRKYAPQIDSKTLVEMREYAAHALKVIGETGVCVPWGWAGVYNQAANYRNVQDLMVDSLDNSDFFNAYMEKITEMQLEYNAALAEIMPDGIGIQGNIANSGMVGRDYFEDYIMPHEKRLADAIKARGRFTVYHNCGRAKVLMKSYVQMGLTAWETISEKPQGDSTLADAKKEVGDSLVLIGNIDQVHFLKEATVKQVEEKVEEIIRVGKPGGKYIFGASDFLEKGTPLTNVRAAIQVAKNCGRY